jgi:hypothetical protein
VFCREKKAGAEKRLPAEGHLSAGQKVPDQLPEVPRGDFTECGMWSIWHFCSGVWGQETVLPKSGPWIL